MYYIYYNLIININEFCHNSILMIKRLKNIIVPFNAIYQSFINKKQNFNNKFKQSLNHKSNIVASLLLHIQQHYV